MASAQIISDSIRVVRISYFVWLPLRSVATLAPLRSFYYIGIIVILLYIFLFCTLSLLFYYGPIGRDSFVQWCIILWFRFGMWFCGAVWSVWMVDGGWLWWCCLLMYSSQNWIIDQLIFISSSWYFCTQRTYGGHCLYRHNGHWTPIYRINVRLFHTIYCTSACDVFVFFHFRCFG